MGGYNEAQQDLVGLLRSLIREETKWLKHYQGKVLKNQDPNKLSRVCVAIPELGWEDEKMGFWAFPRDKNCINVPQIGDFVEIYFMSGNPSRPVYMGIIWESYDSSPVKNFDGSPNHHVLFEDPKNSTSYIKYSDKVFDFAKILSLDVAKKALTILEGTEPFVLGNAFKTYFDAHVHTSAAPTVSTSAPTVPMPINTLSTNIKGK